jgi:hypothetical protein
VTSDVEKCKAAMVEERKWSVRQQLHSGPRPPGIAGTDSVGDSRMQLAVPDQTVLSIAIIAMGLSSYVSWLS